MHHQLRWHRAITQAWKLMARKSTRTLNEQYLFPNILNFYDVLLYQGPKPDLAYYKVHV